MSVTDRGTAAGATRLAVGLVDLAVRAVASTAEGAAQVRHLGSPVVPDAAFGLASELRRRSRWVVAGVGAVAVPCTRAAVRALVPSFAADAVSRRVARWSALGAAERLRARAEAEARARALVRALAGAVLDEIDVDAVADRLDVDRVAARLDLDAVLARVDLDAVLARVDLDGVVARVDLDSVLARVDLDAVLDRVDLDALLARVDPDTVLARVDLVAYAESVLDELDLGRVVRDTGGSITAETLDAFRDQNARADRLVQRLTDRLLHRAGPSGAGGLADGPTSPMETP
ncbi:hypothetical protein [Streptomyces griseorubiginosus]|uniref:hypothetical protein n=1 Tax=Streptomyces griseorubiginosus TaxID=67304 RepID=UPI002E82291B|nr:hypothetical protein [Streptomyces griseorubiginosus]WUB42862.1 hypothetical protein OHN19_05750 [Streptomyces griseorubiginosus]WUB51381.1 hypothetical protein OG942_05745 [Streptomyces griseorubiginosus]